MRSIFILILLCLTFDVAVAQSYQDTISFRHFDEVYNRLRSRIKSDKAADLEFRFWTHYSTTDFTSLLLFSKVGTQWKSKRFEYYSSRRNPIKEVAINQNNIDSVWNVLVENKVLVLPTEEVLKPLRRKFVIDTLQIRSSDVFTYNASHLLDGIVYGFEMLSDSGGRRYSYGSPAYQLKSYPNIEEYYRVAVIINVLSYYLGEPMREF